MDGKRDKRKEWEKICITNTFLLFTYFTRRARMNSLLYLLFLIARIDSIEHFNFMLPSPLSIQSTINRTSD